MFAGASQYADKVDSTMLYIVGISVVFLIGITAAMIYFVFRYSRKKNPVASQIEGNLWLEAAWIVIPTLIVLSMFYYSYTDFYEMRSRTDIEMEVRVTGRTWEWGFEYSNGKKSDTLYLPVNTVIKANITSVDVLHSFYIPAFRIKEDAVPNRMNYIIIEPEETGSYDIACAEYCGDQHAYMYSKAVIMSKKEFEAWLGSEEEPVTENDVAIADDHIGINVLVKNGCMACHTTDGSVITGPSFKDLALGKATVITDGKEREIRINDEYLKRSILEPDADIVKGYPASTMPKMKGQLNEKELEDIIKVLKSMN